MGDQTIELKVDIQTFNTIIAGLEELPHKLSRRTIDELARQAQSQVENQSGGMGNPPPKGPLSNKVIQ